jgi:endonuclease/exonuclease/phosphatase (EEP) superfamily protein YafD
MGRWWREVALGAALGAAVLGWLGGLWWPLEAWSAWSVHVTLFALLGALAVFAAGRKRLGQAAILGCLVQVVALISTAPRPQDPGDRPHALSVVAWNAQFGRTGFDAALAGLMAQDADVIVVTELDAPAHRGLDGLRGAYPHTLLSPSVGPEGVGLWSKAPLVDARVVQPSGDWPRDALVAQVSGVTVAAVHLQAPRSARHAAARSDQVDWLVGLTGPRVVVGDLNSAPWMHASGRLRRSGLRAGGTFKATWPVALGPLGLPLDHVLGSDALMTQGVQVLESWGSDHRAVRADWVWRAGTPWDTTPEPARSTP